MDENFQKEQFSNAYLRAIAAAAGYQTYKPEPDVDKCDWGIAASGARGTRRSPRLEVQLKCTSREILGPEELSFRLDADTFENLRDPNLMVPKILVIVVVPLLVTDWLLHSEEQLALRHCAYWRSLRGMADLGSQQSTTIRIPRVQQFTTESLAEMMDRIGAGGVP